MKKIFLKFSSLLIFLFLFETVTPLCEKVPEAERSATKCTGEAAANTDEECCYLEGFSETYDGTDPEKECVEIKKADVTNNTSIDSIIGKITKGEYWAYSNYTEKYLEINQVVCKNSKFEKSPCEIIENPSGFKDCKEKTTRNKDEVCCFLDGGEEEGKECVDIPKKDESITDATKESIKKGQYWADYTRTYSEIKELKCGENGASSTKYSGLLALLVVLLNLF